MAVTVLVAAAAEVARRDRVRARQQILLLVLVVVAAGRGRLTVLSGARRTCRASGGAVHCCCLIATVCLCLPQAGLCLAWLADLLLLLLTSR